MALTADCGPSDTSGMCPPMAIPFLRTVLEEPGYGWERDGAPYKPTASEIGREWRSRMNLFATRKAWLPVTNWFWTVCLMPFAVVFLAEYFSWKLMLAGFLYSMVFAPPPSPLGSKSI